MIAKRIPLSATYAEAMCELYVRRNVAKGWQAADEGRFVSHATAGCRLNLSGTGRRKT